MRGLGVSGRLPDVAPLPPGVATGRESSTVPASRLWSKCCITACQSTIGRIVSMLNDVGLDISARQHPCLESTGPWPKGRCFWDL